MMGIVLKPCPFCGASDPKIIDNIAERRWRVDCKDCTASVSTAFRDATIALWNKRVEVPAPADPFMPDWSAAPTWARWHAFDHDGGGNWFDSQPKLSGSVWHTALQYDFSGNAIPLSGLDWRNSLRHRPDGV